jgi:D-threo-aldose 1-dehydrogenase
LIAGAQTKSEVSDNAAMMGVATPVALWDDLKRNNLLEPDAPVPQDSAKETQSC